MPRPKVNVLYELDGQWISTIGGKRNLYHFWNDARAGRVRRASLGTPDLEGAKRRFAQAVVAGRTGTSDSLLSAVLLKYFTERTDKLPSKTQSRNAGRVLLKCWGVKMTAGGVTEAKQKEFAEWSIKRGNRLSYVQRNLVVLKTALNHCGVSPPATIITSETKMRERWGVIGKAPRRVFIPTDTELARVLAAPAPVRLQRWMVVSLLTHCRPEAALDLAPAARRRDAGVTDLNPEGRIQNKKFRPIVREPRCLRVALDRWEQEGLDDFGGRYCGYTSVEGVKSALERLRSSKEVNLLKLSTYSFRHKVTSVLRRSRVHEDQVSTQMGHRRKDLRSTSGYGEFDPDYLKDAARALDVWFLKLRRLTKSHANRTEISVRTKKAA